MNNSTEMLRKRNKQTQKQLPQTPAEGSPGPQYALREKQAVNWFCSVSNISVTFQKDNVITILTSQSDFTALWQDITLHFKLFFPFSSPPENTSITFFLDNLLIRVVFCNLLHHTDHCLFKENMKWWSKFLFSKQYELRPQHLITTACPLHQRSPHL